MITENFQTIKLKTKDRFSLGIDHLWFIIPLLAFGIVISLQPIPPHDFWWHLKIGKIITTTGSIPTTNIFSWSLPDDTPFTYGAWLGEYLLYLVYLVGHLPLVLFLRTVLMMLSFALVGFEAFRRTGSWRIAGLVLLLGVGMSSNNVIVRPQIWAFLPFVIFLFLLVAYIDRRIRPFWLYLLPLVMVFWVNVHGTYILGFILLGIFLIGEGLQKLLKMEENCSWKEISFLLQISLLSVLAILINPQTFRIFTYVLRLMTDLPSQRLVSEWQSPTPNTLPAIIFFLSILVFIAGFAYSSCRLRITELLLILAFTWLAWNGIRYVIWYAMVITPVLAAVIKDFIGRPTWLASSNKNVFNLILVLMFFVPFVIVQPWFIGKLPLPEKYREQVLVETSEGPMLSTDTPISAVEYLRANPGGNLFNEMGYGSYLIWALPEQKVFVDPRVELYPYEQWLDYIRISQGVRHSELLEDYGIDRLLLDKQHQKELLEVLGDDPYWHQEYADNYSQIWTRSR